MLLGAPGLTTRSKDATRSFFCLLSDSRSGFFSRTGMQYRFREDVEATTT